MGLIKIEHKIFNIRNLQVILDSDLAVLYDVPTKILNQAVKRNIERFPAEFMFQLTDSEYQSLRSHFVTSRHGGRRHLPYAFTEQGVAMLSGVLRSATAIRMSIQIMQAFVSMRKFLLNNARLFQQIENHENKLIEHDQNFKRIFNLIEQRDLKPQKGIFYDGQIFDAYTFVSNLIRRAKKSIALIDNYVDDSVLTLFTKRKKNVAVTIYTKSISNQLRLDLKKYNSQYSLISIKEFNNSHDRFIIIDSKEVYHFGASLKDLGKKWFAFSKFDKEAITLLKRLENSPQPL